LYEQIKAVIIRKLVNKNMWGAKYTSHILSGIPKHLQGEAKEVIEALVKQGWLVPKKKSETLFHLNQEKVAEIKQYYEKITNNSNRK